VKVMSVLRRITGIGTTGSLALALLAGGCVLAATAGPRQAQATGTRALQQTVTGVLPVDRTITTSANWATISNLLGIPTYSLAIGSDLALTPANLDSGTTQLRRDFGTPPLRLAPQSADWVGMTPAPYPVNNTVPTLKGIPAQLEVAYRYPVAGHLRLVAGTMPDTVLRLPRVTVIQVVVTTQTAKLFALRPGSQLAIGVPSPANAGQTIKVDLVVTGIVEPTDPGSSFWTIDPLLPGPSLEYLPGGEAWVGSVIADPGESRTVQEVFGIAGLDIQWELPVDVAGLGGQAQPLFSQMSRLTNQTPTMTGYLKPAADAMAVSSGMVQPLAALVQATNSVNVLLWMVYAGIAVAGIVMLLLAARMVAGRRSAEMTLRQGRGASVTQIFWLGFLGAAVVCVPAAALAWVVAVLLVPAAAPAGPAAWWPGIATLLIATAGPGVAAAWQHRLPRHGQARRRRRRSTRVVFEVTACIAAIGGIVVFRTEAGAGDLFTSTAPVLVAVPAVIVILRLYQLLLRGLARASVRRRGVIGFLGLARAAQAAITLALPAITLVLAITVAAFTGMVRDAVLRGETAVSWQATGADVVVTAPFSLNTLESVISPAAVRAIAAVPGIQHAATALVVPLRTSNGAEITCIAVNPASYAALVGSTEGFSPVKATLLTEPQGQGAIPVLASSQAATELASTGGAITSQQGLPALRVRISGELRSTPALPAGGAFIVLPQSALRSIGAPPANLMLLTGASIDMTRLRAAVQATTNGANAPSVISRSAVLQQLAGAPLQQGTFLLFTLAIGFAAALALTVILLDLALGAADREVTLARLAAMGLTEGQRIRLAAFEVLPAIAASAVAAIACAIALPRLVAPAVNLSAFTQSQTPVPLRPDVASFVVPLAGVLAVTIIALAYQIRSGHGRRVAITMRSS
jgi:putative ABC transport system permease protein